MQILPAIAVDVICILVFAIVGRSSHQEATDLLGVAHTAWPFLAGCLVGTLLGRTWRHPLSLRSGIAVWFGTILIGMTLRLLSGGGVSLSFVIVASCALALLLLGWRAGLQLIQHARAKPSADPEHKPDHHASPRTPHRVP
jgi:peptidoglycan/LPS O-acetylase OafA/YrhL